MAQTHALPALSPVQPEAAGATAGSPEGGTLSAARPGQNVRIVHIGQEAEHAAWLRAVGMHEGAEVTVLRRAPFGGPLHLRLTDGGEFAIHRDLARCIEVRAAQGPAGKGPDQGSTA